jgi:hypothetical protein
MPFKNSYNDGIGILALDIAERITKINEPFPFYLVTVEVSVSQVNVVCSEGILLVDCAKACAGPKGKEQISELRTL